MKTSPDQALLEENIARLESENRLLRESLSRGSGELASVSLAQSTVLEYHPLFDQVPCVVYRFAMDSRGAFHFEHIGAN
jgi:hypothetical protein